MPSPGLHQGFPSSLPHSASLPQGLPPYHPFNSLILAAQLQPQYTLLSLLSKNEQQHQRHLPDDDDEPGQLVIKEDGPREEDDKLGNPTEESRPIPRDSHFSPAAAATPSLQSVLSKVNSSVTMKKFEEVVSQASTNSLLRATSVAEDLHCHLCSATFSNRLEALQHARHLCPRLPDVSSAQESYKGQLIEGLAARLCKEAGSRRDLSSSLNNISNLQPSQFSYHHRGLEEEPSNDLDFNHVIDEEETMSDGKKIRVRSHIREDQLSILKYHYACNPRPKKDELQFIADKVNFPIRVVQVWFQNARARDRREGRCLTPNPFLPPHISYSNSSIASPLTTVNGITSAVSSPTRINSSSLVSPSKFLAPFYSTVIPESNNNTTNLNDGKDNSYSPSALPEESDMTEDEEPKPLDLSTRKSSTCTSPKSSSTSDSDNDSTSLAISLKSESRTPTPTYLNNNIAEAKDTLTALHADNQSKLAQILSNAKLNISAENYEYSEKRPRVSQIFTEEIHDCVSLLFVLILLLIFFYFIYRKRTVLEMRCAKENGMKKVEYFLVTSVINLSTNSLPSLDIDMNIQVRTFLFLYSCNVLISISALEV